MLDLKDGYLLIDLVNYNDEVDVANGFIPLSELKEALEEIE